MATHTKSGMPRRSKGSKHSVRIFIFSGPFCFVGSDSFVGPDFLIVILDVSGFKTVTIRSGVKNPVERTTFYVKRRSGARVMTCSVCPEHTSFSGTRTYCLSGRHIRDPVSALPKAGGIQAGSGLGGTPPPSRLLGRRRAPVKLTNLQAQSPGLEPTWAQNGSMCND